MDLNVRDLIEGEENALGHLMHKAIQGSTSAYSKAQRQAWCAAPPSGPKWQSKLHAQSVLVAVIQDQPIGFMSRKVEYVDLCFVRPTWQSQGVFSRLYRMMESQAVAQGVDRLWVHASIMAQPAFAAQGFRVIRHENVPYAGQVLARAEMEKTIR